MKTIKNYIYNICLLAFLGIGLFSCNDFLDVVPDNRVQLDTPKKVSDLLISAYPSSNPSLIGELSSDNMLDNRVPNENGIFKRDNAYDLADTQLFEWKDIIGKPGTSDAPFSIWQSFYHSIAACNLALEAIDLMIAEGEETNMDAQRGEALAIRAYCHFVLVNMFAMPFRDFEASKEDKGITYMLSPETQVEGNDYQRNSVAEVYELIIKDIEEAIPLINNEVYKHAKYRFNRDAAHALAARVHLFVRNYDKVIEHADAVLGTGKPTLRSCWNNKYNDLEQKALAYFDIDEPANLLIISTYSTQMRRLTSSGARYGYRVGEMIGQTEGKNPWTGGNGQLPHFGGNWIMHFTGTQDLTCIHPIAWEFFEYSDRIAGIGYCHILRAEFTTDMLLLERAEAKVFKEDYDGALVDLNYWGAAHKIAGTLNADKVEAFYKLGEYPGDASTNLPPYSFSFNNDKMSNKFIVNETQKPFVDCLLHLRRMERFMQGDRWYDIKRYGIELVKVAGIDSRILYLPWNDSRRAIQIPSEVIEAGYELNERPTNSEPNK